MNKLHKQFSKANLLEVLPNKNIFQTDNEYRMLQDLRFEQEEKNYRNNMITRFAEIIPILIVIMIIKNIFFLFTEYGTISTIISLIRIPMIILLNFLLFFLKRNTIKIIEESDFIRMILEIDNVLNVMAAACKIHDDPSFISLSIQYLICTFCNFIFSLNMKTCMLYITFESVVLFSFYDHPESYLFVRLFKNIFSKKVFKVIFSNFCAIVLQYSIAKGLRELWALYDSFKRGYFALKNIYDEFPYPVFVLNVKKQNYSTTTQNNLCGFNSSYNYQIYYKNKEAESLFIQIRILKDKNFDPTKRNQSKNPCALKELIDPQVEKLFDFELEKCLNGESNFFDFPLIIGDRKITFKENKNFCTLFEGDLHKIKWVKIFANRCNWRTNEAVILQIMNNEDLQNSLLNNDYGDNIEKELSTLIENLDLICDKSPDMNLIKPIEKTNVPNQRNGQVNPKGHNTPNVLRSPSPHNQLYKNMLEVKHKQFIANSPQSFLFVNSGMKPDGKTSIQHRLNLPKNNILNLPQINKNSMISPRNYTGIANQVAKEQNSSFDYTTLFLLKHSLNYIQDVFLTINVVMALRMNKILHKQTKIDFEDFIPHIVDYLYPIAKMKNFVFKLNLIEEDIVVVYEYYRVIFFNTIFFILNNSQDNSEKKIEITLDHSRWTDHGNYYETSFTFNDRSPIVKYESLPVLLKTLSSKEFKHINLDQFKFIDGLIVASYLLSNIHNNEIEIETIGENKYKIHFCIFGGAINNIEPDCPSKLFTRSRSMIIEQLFYDRMVKMTGNNLKYLRNESQEKTKYSKDIIKSEKILIEVNGKKPIFDEATDECKIFILNNCNKIMQMKIKMSRSKMILIYTKKF